MKPSRKKDRPRRLLLLLFSAALIWGIFTTAGSPDPTSALDRLLNETDLAMTFLRLGLGAPPQDPWSAGPAAVVISQSPLLTGGKATLLELRRAEEQPEVQEEPEEIPHQPVAETPVEPQLSPQRPVQSQPDNGIPAKTLLPGDSTDYLVSGLTYVNNTSACTLTAEELTGDYAHIGEGAPQVLILHTHGSEAYTMPPGQEYEASSEYRTTDTVYNVVRVGDEIADILAREGISVVHDRVLYDYPEYSGAYTRSMESTKAYLERYPSIRFVLDIHRDAIADSEGNMYKIVTETEKGRAAQLSLVMGSNGGGSDHDLWKENLRLAVAVQNRLLEENPELMRPITLRNSHYNQMATTGSLLVEVGAAGNSLNEALISARLFAKGFADVVR